MKTARHIECKTLKKEGQWKAVPSEILVKIYIYIFPTVKSTLPLLFKTHIYFLKIVLFYFMESKFTGNFDN